MKALLAAATVVLTILNAAVVSADEKHHPSAAKAAAQAPDVLTGAEVRRVDKAGKKITLKHEEIKSLDMPPMTMVFQVKDPAMLDRVKAGDKVKFSAENIGGAYTLTQIEAAK